MNREKISDILWSKVFSLNNRVIKTRVFGIEVSPRPHAGP